MSVLVVTGRDGRPDLRRIRWLATLVLIAVALLVPLLLSGFQQTLVARGAVAGVLITPRIAFTPFSLTVIVIDAFVAALIGRLTSLPLTVVGAMFLGLAQTFPGAFVSNDSAASGLVTFLLVIGTLAVLFRPGFARIRLA